MSGKVDQPAAMIHTRFGISGRAKIVPSPRAATACEIAEATLLFPFLLHLNRSIREDLIQEMRRAHELRYRRILLQDVEDVGVFRHVAEHMGMKSPFHFFPFRRPAFAPPFLHLSLNSNFYSL